ncbi:hypothetical protein [Neolewinella litorea]|uniref:Bacterial surface antigen (D15) domain-containing protein n=1 Tax=Neolewinella litorea TaxID=2562452 RepID=A0A4V3XKD6_9BACT|nr:hypothetical protein [Neolewinella litorea]THH36523.1 hypothetical protein E4021_14750 [Neolewinella litorea]
MLHVRLCLALILFVGFGHLSAQESPAPVAYDCSTGSYLLSREFQVAYDSGDLQQAREVLDRWGELCGLREITNRAMLLIGLRTNDVLDIDYLDQQFDFLMEYRQRRTLEVNEAAYYYDYNRPYYGFLPIGGEYDAFTRPAFSEISPKRNAEFDYLRRSYAAEELPELKELAGAEYAGTSLQKDFLFYRDEALAMTEGHVAAMAGAWIPLGEASLLGPHPQLGFAVGGKKRRMNYDMEVAFQFLKSSSDYLARREKGAVAESTDKFFGGRIGATVGYDLWASGAREVQVIGGLGFSGFDALNDTDDLQAASVLTYDLSGGVGFRRYLTPSSYLGISLRAHLVDFRLNEVVDFTGVPLSLTVAYGSVANALKQTRLAQLGYSQRQ